MLCWRDRATRINEGREQGNPRGTVGTRKRECCGQWWSCRVDGIVSTTPPRWCTRGDCHVMTYSSPSTTHLMHSVLLPCPSHYSVPSYTLFCQGGCCSAVVGVILCRAQLHSASSLAGRPRLTAV